MQNWILPKNALKKTFDRNQVIRSVCIFHSHLRRGAPQYWRSVWVHHRHVRTQGPGVSNILPQGDPLGGWVAFLKHVVFANWDYYPEVGCENNVLWAMCRCWGGMKLFSGTTSKGWLNPVTCNGWCVWNWNATHLHVENVRPLPFVFPLSKKVSIQTRVPNKLDGWRLNITNFLGFMASQFGISLSHSQP